MALKVGVLGAAGRMGSEVCRAVEADGELELVARVTHDDDVGWLIDSGAEVAVEFTVPDSVKDNVIFCVENGLPVVVGATGLTNDDLEEIAALSEAHGAPVFVAPNFAIGAVLMMRFASEAARYFATAEIVERHHEKKLDAPSGTSLRTAALMNESRGRPWSSSDHAGREPSRGLDRDGISIHSVRLPGSVAHQEVILGAPGETLTIRHDSLDRSSFMPGVLLAIKKVRELSGVTVGLEQILDR
ncbi:MAG: 4-hydroxy-tetrahydrodipicolinate reductase [Actinomycetota bacterium]